ASKFVRGDAVAGIIITLVNVIGGFAIGALERGWGIVESLQVFTRLTIGDGLVSQVPAFIIAIAAGLIVARTGGKETIGDEIPKQLTSQPLALYMIGGFLAMLAFTPLPTIPLFAAALILVGIAFAHQYAAKLDKKTQENKARMEAAATPAAQQPVEELLLVDQLELEIGYGLVQLVDASRGGDLLNRISMIRRQLAAEMGIVVPPVRIRDNMQLDPNAYRVKLRGAVIGDGRVYPHLLMAMDSGLASGRIDGVAGKEPAFGLEATWIQPELKARAENMNYTVVDSTSVMATHLTELVKSHADELLTRQEVSRLIDQVKKESPKLVDDVVGGLVKMGDVQKVLQNLLHERVPVKDLPTILETLGDWAGHTKDVAVLTEYVRNALRRTISAQYAETDEHGTQRLYCVTIDPTVEDTLNGYIDRGPAGTTVSVPSSLANRLVNVVSTTAEKLITAGHQLVILCSPTVRSPLRQILEPHLPSVAVLAYNEVVRGLDVESMGLVQWRKEDAVVLGASAA
ncbi:MAG TPA: flagellar biosynthesis protein FlhA, partial [Phycisphaerales bacterium]|nr:flagellar biosynthesis protein FlhA [Phycisphaerales bacterium]